MYSINYYSPTGNTKYLAEQLAQNLNIDQVFDIVKNPDTNSEHIIIMFSIQAFSAPKKVVDFVKGFEKGNKKVSIIAVGCNEVWINDGASLKLKKILNEKGYQIMLDEVVAMPLTLVMAFPEELSKKLVKEATKRMEELSRLLMDNQVTRKEVPLKSKMISRVGGLEKQAAKLFGLELHANNDCTSCGICWESCPADNIKEKNGKPSFGFKCTLCLKCVYECPVDSISPYVSKFIPIKNGYSIENHK
jgi:ferredoxin